MTGRLSADDGISLVEVLVTATLLLVVAAVVSSGVITGVRQQRRHVEQVTAMSQAKTALERMSRDLRAADPLQQAQAERVSVRVRRSGGSHVVDYFLEPNGAGRGRLVAQTGAQRTVLVADVAAPATGLFRYYGDGGAEVGAVAAGDPTVVRAVAIDLPVHLSQFQPWRFTDRVTLRNVPA